MNGRETTAEEWVETNKRKLGNNANSMDLMKLAISDGRKDVVEGLISGTHTVNGETLAHVLSITGDIKTMEKVIKIVKERGAGGPDAIHEFINKRNSEDDMPIHLAAGHGSTKGYTEVVDLLLKNGADVNAKGSNGSTAIYRAAQQGRTDVLEYLLEYVENKFGPNGVLHAILDSKNDEDFFPLLIAVFWERVECIKHLCRCLKKHGMKVDDVKNEGGDTLLLAAARVGLVESIDCLVSLGADVNAKNDLGYTPIFAASAEGRTEAIRCLVKHGAKVNGFGKTDPDTPLMIAAMTGQVASIDCLVKLGADINETTNDGQTAMSAAASNGQTAAAEYLKMLGAKS